MFNGINTNQQPAPSTKQHRQQQWQAHIVHLYLVNVYIVQWRATQIHLAFSHDWQKQWRDHRNITIKTPKAVSRSVQIPGECPCSQKTDTRRDTENRGYHRTTVRAATSNNIVRLLFCSFYFCSWHLIACVRGRATRQSRPMHCHYVPTLNRIEIENISVGGRGQR